MRVAQVKELGGPEVLVPVEVPDPVTGPDEMLVDVAAADTLFLETRLRTGWGREWFDVEPPYVPGNGVAGTVSAVGDGVAGSWRGRRVAAHTGQRGGYAERAVVPLDATVAVPDDVDLDIAAALLHDGVTALSLLDAVPVRSSDRVLVTAAAGGMGVLLVQLAVAAGAQVVGTARGERKLELVTAQDAAAVDYSLAGWTDRVIEALGGQGPDVVFDGTGGELGAAAFGIVTNGGRFSAHGASSGSFSAVVDSPDEARRRGITVTGIEKAQHDPAELPTYAARALAAAAEGRLRPVIGARFPLDRAADAHAAMEARDVLGKTLLVP